MFYELTKLTVITSGVRPLKVTYGLKKTTHQLKWKRQPAIEESWQFQEQMRSNYRNLTTS